MGFVIAMVIIFRRKLHGHRANTQIMHLAVAFSTVIPLFRVAIMIAPKKTQRSRWS